jgi:hypothetical protein
MIRFDLLEVVDSGRGPREYIAACTQLFLDNLLLECGSNCSVVPDTDVNIRLVTRSQDLTLNWKTDETYTLDIAADSRGGYQTVIPYGNSSPASLAKLVLFRIATEIWREIKKTSNIFSRKIIVHDAA